MVAQRQSGGPGGRSAYRVTWEGSRVKAAVDAAMLAGMQKLASDLEAYLHATLHRDTGEMADKAFAVVEVVGDRIVIRAGSDAAHTIYHELIYHPQLRQAMDVWAPKISALVRAAASAAS